jgi:hypothetical protein
MTEKIGGVLITRKIQNFVDYFRVSKAGESKALHQDSRRHEVRNSKSAKSPVGEPVFAENIGVQHFDIFEDKR